MLKILFLEFLRFGIVTAVFDPSKVVPMADYSQDFRVLSCWDCFEARGKMCTFD